MSINGGLFLSVTKHCIRQDIASTHEHILQVRLATTILDIFYEKHSEPYVKMYVPYIEDLMFLEPSGWAHILSLFFLISNLYLAL